MLGPCERWATATAVGHSSCAEPLALAMLICKLPATAPASHLQLRRLLCGCVQRAKWDDALCGLQPALRPHIPGHAHCRAGGSISGGGGAAVKRAGAHRTAASCCSTLSRIRLCTVGTRPVANQAVGQAFCSLGQGGGGSGGSEGPTSIDLLQLCKLSLHLGGGDHGQPTGGLPAACGSTRSAEATHHVGCSAGRLWLSKLRKRLMPVCSPPRRSARFQTECPLESRSGGLFRLRRGRQGSRWALGR